MQTALESTPFSISHEILDWITWSFDRLLSLSFFIVWKSNENVELKKNNNNKEKENNNNQRDRIGLFDVELLERDEWEQRHSIDELVTAILPRDGFPSHRRQQIWRTQ